MSPQLVKLTNTLRTKKKMCQGSHPDQDQTCSANHSEEVVFRAVSPHGHVYWEIEPKNQHIVQESPVPQHLRHIPNPNGVFDATNGIGKYPILLLQTRLLITSILYMIFNYLSTKLKSKHFNSLWQAKFELFVNLILIYSKHCYKIHNIITSFLFQIPS